MTIGGAIASDIHGKNHHVEGTFCQHVRSMDLLLPSGEVRTLTPDGEGAEAFWATAGGMGLTGIVLRATLDLLPITSAYMRVDTERPENLDDCMQRMSERDDEYRYSVAWVDSLTRGASMGRSVLQRGDHASADELPARKLKRGPLKYVAEPKLSAPPWVPDGLLRPSTVRAFNEVWFRKAPKSHTGYESIPFFFHPLDGVLQWNKIYGRPGFIQYQFAVPLAATETVRSALDRLSAAKCPSFLTVLKRFGPANDGPLSFPQPGWTLTVDIPASHRRAGSAAGRARRARRGRRRPRVPVQGQPPAARSARGHVPAARRVAQGAGEPGPGPRAAVRPRPAPLAALTRSVVPLPPDVGVPMNDALGGVQTVLVLGGTSELALATLRAMDLRPGARVALAGRNPAALAEVTVPGADVVALPWDAADSSAGPELIEKAVAELGDLDVVLAAAGILGEQERAEADPAHAAEILQVNLVGLVAARDAGRGAVEEAGPRRARVFSSVAGLRGRRSNFVYGASKAGLDALVRGAAGLAGRQRRPARAGAPRLRAHEDDRRPGGSPVHDDAGRGRRRRGEGDPPRQGRRARSAGGRAGVRRAAGAAAADLPTPAGLS